MDLVQLVVKDTIGNNVLVVEGPVVLVVSIGPVGRNEASERKCLTVDKPSCISKIRRKGPRGNYETPIVFLI